MVKNLWTPAFAGVTFSCGTGPGSRRGDGLRHYRTPAPAPDSAVPDTGSVVRRVATFYAIVKIEQWSGSKCRSISSPSRTAVVGSIRKIRSVSPTRISPS
jgi:hypothetical protein